MELQRTEKKAALKKRKRERRLSTEKEKDEEVQEDAELEVMMMDGEGELTCEGPDVCVVRMEGVPASSVQDCEVQSQPGM